MVLQSILRSTPLQSPRRSVRFASPIHTHSRSLSSYLRSPYPSAPFSPTGQDEGSSQWPKHRDADDIISPAHSASFSTVTPGAHRSPYSLGRSIFSPTVSSITRLRKPAPLDLESRFRVSEPSSIIRKKPAPLDLESRLSEDFWQSLSLADSAKSDDEPMVTALEYPESAVQYEEKMNIIDTHQALLSPRVPKPSPTPDKIRDSLMSPGKKSSFGRIVRKDFTAPSPNDPFAAFPSFAAVLAMGYSEGGHSSVL